MGCARFGDVDNRLAVEAVVDSVEVGSFSLLCWSFSRKASQIQEVIEKSLEVRTRI